VFFVYNRSSFSEPLKAQDTLIKFIKGVHWFSPPDGTDLRRSSSIIRFTSSIMTELALMAAVPIFHRVAYSRIGANL
ncbi:hypothetical protein, partial [Pedobacter miscanthi]|uniref:hypothetical protein n=1 Tax=Pedobacter miscanthi TaxID=2259170 RepID=UPI002930B5D3